MRKGAIITTSVLMAGLTACAWMGGEEPMARSGELDMALQEGGTRMTADQIRYLLVNATHYYRTPAGATGYTYVAENGAMRDQSEAGGLLTLRTGMVRIEDGMACFGKSSADMRCSAVVNTPQGVRFYSVDDGTLQATLTGVAPGNSEHL